MWRVSPQEGDEDTQARADRHCRSKFNQMREKKELTDAVLLLDDGEVPVHRVILSGSSRYFQALFTSGLAETGEYQVRLPQLKVHQVEPAITWVYTRRLEIDEENVESLLPVADRLGIESLLERCCGFILDHMTEENCLGIRAFANRYFCASLERAARKFALRHFEALVNKCSGELLQLTADEFGQMLEKDELNVKKEEVVFEAVVKWIQEAPEQRGDDIVTLLPKVRLGLLTTQYIFERVKTDPLVAAREKCRPIIIEALKLMYDQDLTKQATHPLARPRVPADVLFVMGGWSRNQPTDLVETYDSRADRWLAVPCADSAGPRAYHGAATLGRDIYIIGGYDGSAYFKTVRKFSTTMQTWCEVAPMTSERCYVTVTVCDGMIYAIGGFDGHNRLNTCERYNAARNQWSVISPMSEQRSDANAVEFNGKVFVAGGFNGTDCLETAEMYDPATNQWTLLPPMWNRRSGLGVCAYGGAIFALGGFNGIARLDTGEKYNPEKRTWTPISNMYMARSNFATAVLDDQLFAVGGFNGTETVSQVECYDGRTEEWLDAAAMNQSRSALTAVLVSDLEDVSRYCHQSRGKETEKSSGDTC